MNEEVYEALLQQLEQLKAENTKLKTENAKLQTEISRLEGDKRSLAMSGFILAALFLLMVFVASRA